MPPPRFAADERLHPCRRVRRGLKIASAPLVAAEAICGGGEKGSRSFSTPAAFPKTPYKNAIICLVN